MSDDNIALLDDALEDFELNDEVDEVGDEIELTTDEVLAKIGFGWFQVRVLLAAGLNWLCDSMEMMLLSFLPAPVACEFQITSLQQSLLVFFVFFAMFWGAMFFGAMSDFLGRRRSTILGMMITFSFGVLSSFAPTIEWLFVFRALTGFGIGSAHVSLTLFAEYLPKKRRAAGMLLIEIFWAVGTIFEALLAEAVIPTYGWRALLLGSSMPLLVGFMTLPWLPESPRWLMLQGQHTQATSILIKAAAQNNKQLETFVLKKPVETSKRSPVVELFGKRFRSGTLLLAFIWWFAAFQYYNVVLVTVTLFGLEASGQRCAAPSSMDMVSSGFMMTTPAPTSEYAPCVQLAAEDYRDAMIEALAEIPGILFTLLIIDKLGRKRSQTLQYFVMAAMFVLLIFCFSRTMETVFLFIARACIVGAFQVLYVYTPELYPTRIRSTALGFFAAVSRTGGLAAPIVSQWLAAQNMSAALIVSAVGCVVSGVCALLLPVETSGQPLRDTVHELDDHGQVAMRTLHVRGDEDDKTSDPSADSSESASDKIN